MNATVSLHNLGHSLWLDNLSRDLLNDGMGSPSRFNSASRNVGCGKKNARLCRQSATGGCRRRSRGEKLKECRPLRQGGCCASH